jgi:hypothetical protein
MMESKKDIAVSFLQLASSGNVRQAFRKYVHPQFSHHTLFLRNRNAILFDNARAGGF